MTIEEVRAEKAKFEGELLSFIHQKSEEFSKKTGFCPESIYVVIHRVDAIGMKSYYEVVGVDVELEKI